jgi:hypothetical protein
MVEIPEIVTNVPKPEYFVWGENYFLHSSLDYYGDIFRCLFDGNNITINRDKFVHTISKPVGFNESLENSTFPQF